MSDIHFEWDDAKAKSNFDKHGVSFSEAVTAFFDVNGVLIADPDHSLEEDRFLLLGMSQSPRLLVVVHCFQLTSNAIRIISARKASRREATQYQW